MKKISLLFLMLAAVLMMVPAYGLESEESSEFTGVVSASSDESGEVVSALLAAEVYDEDGEASNVSYDIEMDENGKDLALNCNGKRVRIIGEISFGESDETETLKVNSFEELADEALTGEDYPEAADDTEDSYVDDESAGDYEEVIEEAGEIE